MKQAARPQPKPSSRPAAASAPTGSWPTAFRLALDKAKQERRAAKRAMR